MKLKAKLARLSTRGLATDLPVAEAPTTGAEAAGQSAPSLRAKQLRARIDALRLARPPADVQADAASGWLEQVVSTPAGPLCQIITSHAAEFCQGQTPVAPCLSVEGTQMAALALDPSLAQVKSHRLLFVDTETTGLAGGAGTLPFLIGVGYFVDGALCVEQWMLRKPGQEVPMLTRLAECLAQADAIVTYNGKSFDWPLLRNRFILNRIKMPAPKPHLDLLHCIRRLLKKRAVQGAAPKRGGMRLTAVERDVLGFVRVGDIDGAHIPERYFDFLRGGPPAQLDAVIEHNRHDLVSLVALLGYAGHRLDDVGVPGSADEHLNLAHIAWRGKYLDRAAAFARRASATGTAHVRAEAALLLGRMLMRQRQDHKAAQAFEGGLAHGAVTSVLQASLHLSLAKLYEHRLRDFDCAMTHAVCTTLAEGETAHDKRVARLRRKSQALSAQSALASQRARAAARVAFEQVRTL